MTAECIDAAVIGAGPAGLAAAEVLLDHGVRPVVFEAKPTAARKFLMAGKSGLNLTKDEPPEAFAAAIEGSWLAPILAGFGPAEIVAWAEGLGERMFTGSSGRIFPVAMKASPLLRRWLARLASRGAEIRYGWRWQGYRGSALAFGTPGGERLVLPGATVLGLGGASWPRLGSNGAWCDLLGARGIPIAPFRPSNMGLTVSWSDHFRDRHAGAPVKPARLDLGGRSVRGEFVITSDGIEGSAVYALSAAVRDALDAGPADLRLDLLPDLSVEAVARRLSRPRGKLSRANHLRRALGLSGARAGLVRELSGPPEDDPIADAHRIKSLKIPVSGTRPLEEAISSAGGVMAAGFGPDLMLTALPGTFVAGEMLDWDAPTGGYLLTASIATGRHAGAGAAEWVRHSGASRQVAPDPAR